MCHGEMNIDNIAKHRTMGSILLSIERSHMLALSAEKVVVGVTIVGGLPVRAKTQHII